MGNNLSMVNLLFEGETETTENITNLKGGLKHAENLAQLASIFKVDVKVVSRAISKDTSALTKEISSISKRIVKKSDSSTLKSFGTQIPDQLKIASKELAIKRLFDATQKGAKPLSKSQVKSIVDATKAETKLVFKDVQTSLGKTGANTTKTGTNTNKTGANTTKTTANTTKNAITKGVEKGKELIKKYPKLKLVGTALKIPLKVLRFFTGLKLIKWLIILGVGGYIYFNYEEWLYGGGKPIDDDTDFEPEIDFLKCILIPLGDDEGVEIKKENDNPVVYVKTGTSYDNEGGLIFRVGGSVETGDGSKKGKWTCNTSGLEINEQASTTDLTSKQLSAMMDDLNDNLMGDFFDNDSTDMSDSLTIIKNIQGSTYKGVPAIKALIHNYPLVYGNSLSDDLNNLTNLDFSGIEQKREILSILGISEKKDSNKPGDSDVKYDGNTRTGIGHITIKWNNE